VSEVKLKEGIRMALSTKLPERKVCSISAGILITATEGDN